MEESKETDLVGDIGDDMNEAAIHERSSTSGDTEQAQIPPDCVDLFQESFETTLPPPPCPIPDNFLANLIPGNDRTPIERITDYTELVERLKDIGFQTVADLKNVTISRLEELLSSGFVAELQLDLWHKFGENYLPFLPLSQYAPFSDATVRARYRLPDVLVNKLESAKILGLHASVYTSEKKLVQCGLTPEERAELRWAETIWKNGH
ncbi:hypothetical protein VKT23_001630 [Stygiomarasmius scandens]|uniref:Uncharacterized protein n=1 Tax=Marasmiellus scandens TaxID=2682957 RepID=A0ABR1K3L1_9AGAR